MRKIIPVVGKSTTNKNIARTVIENALSEYAEMYPMDNFKKSVCVFKIYTGRQLLGGL